MLVSSGAVSTAQAGAAELTAPQGIRMQHNALLHPRLMQAQHDVGRVQLGAAIAPRRHDLKNTIEAVLKPLAPGWQSKAEERE